MAGNFSRLIFDGRYAVRSQWANRTVAVTSLAALVVAITTTAALFTVADTLLLRPLAFRDPNRLVFLGPARADSGAPGRVRPSELARLQTSPFIDGAFGFAESGTGSARGFEDVMQVDVTPGMTDVLGVDPIRGRSFTDDDFTKSAAPFSLITEALWVKRFGADPSILNSLVTLGDRSIRVIGIMPSRFNFPSGASVWRAMPKLSVDIRGIVAVARLKPGVPTVGRLQVDGVEFEVLDFRSGLRPPNVRSVPLVVVLVVAVMLLAVAWIHLGMLRATQLADRQRDLAIRLAIGASRSALFRMAIIESLIFAGTGAALSLLFLPSVVAQVLKLVSTTDTRGLAVLVDYRTVVFLGLATFIGSAATSYLPIRVIARLPLLGALRSTGPAMAQVARFWRTTVLTVQVLVVATAVYMSLVLFQNLRSLTAIDVGFNPRGLLALDYSQMTLPGRSQDDGDLLDGLRRIPGVTLVASGFRPLSPFLGRPEAISATPAAASIDRSAHNAHIVSTRSGYFAALQARIVSGRDFNRGDDPTAVVLSERLARSIAPGMDLLTAGVYVGSSTRRSPVVGIVRDVFSGELSAQSLPFVYVQQRPSSVVIRADTGQLTRIVADVARAAAAPGISPDQVRVYRIQESIDKLLEPERTRASVVGLQSISALLLSVLAVYATAASAFRQQVRHAAIRRALGGSSFDLLRWFIRDLFWAGLLGSTCGIAVGFIGVKWLFPPTLTHPTIDLAACLLTFAIVLGCCSLAAFRPSYQVIRLNPSVVLRNM